MRRGKSPKSLRKPRRLLTLGHSYVVQTNRRLAHEMAIAGGETWEVTAVCPSYFAGRNDLGPIVFKPLESELIPVIPVDAHLTSYVHTFVYGRKLRSVLQDSWDFIHAWEEPYIFAGGQIAYWAPRGVPLVYRSAQNLSKSYPPPFNWIERYSMRRASGWICSGTLVEQNLSQRPGYDKPSTMIPLGVDLGLFKPNPDARREVLQRLGWDAGPPVVGYLGRLSPEKGLTVFMDAFERLPKDYRALIIGKGVLTAKVTEWAAQWPDRVRVCTDVHHMQVPAYLNVMSVMCAPSQTTPSWKEQFGRMIVEAFACGIPVIGSSSGEIPHVIDDTGLIVGEKDIAGWANAIEKMISYPQLAADFAERGLHRAREEFAWPVVAQMYLDFFEQILDGSNCSLCLT